MYGYIYLTTNLKNNRKYIGQRKFSGDPLLDEYLGSGKILKQAIKLYGKENFKKDILKICDCKNDLDTSEKLLIEEYNAVNDPLFYNIHEGGSGGNTLQGLSEEEMILLRKHRSDVAKDRIKNLSDEDRLKNVEHLKKIAKKGGDAFKKVGHSDEFKQKLSKRVSGENNPMYHKTLSPESLAKRKETIARKNKENGIVYKKDLPKKGRIYETGWKHSDETKKKQSLSAITRYNTIDLTITKLEAYNENEKLIFNNGEEVFKYFNKHTKSMESLLRSAIKNKTMYRGYFWRVIN